jgi:hypothetical protein
LELDWIVVELAIVLEEIGGLDAPSISVSNLKH